MRSYRYSLHAALGISEGAQCLLGCGALSQNRGRRLGRCGGSAVPCGADGSGQRSSCAGKFAVVKARSYALAFGKRSVQQWCPNMAGGGLNLPHELRLGGLCLILVRMLRGRTASGWAGSGLMDVF